MQVLKQRGELVVMFSVTITTHQTAQREPAPLGYLSAPPGDILPGLWGGRVCSE